MMGESQKTTDILVHKYSFPITLPTSAWL